MHSHATQRSTPLRTLAGLTAVCLLLGGTALAQTATPLQRPASAPERTSTEQRVETIHIEDTATRIDELRIGGETRSITVQPKDGMPGYQVTPATGERRWKVLGF